MTAATLDSQFTDEAAALSTCFLKDGTSLPTAAIGFNTQDITGVKSISAQRFVVTGATVPANGCYLSAANTLAFASNTLLRGSVNATGNWVLAAPTAGVGLTVNGFSGSLVVNAPSSTGAALTANLLAGQFGLVVQGDGGSQYMAQLNSSSATTGRNAINYLNTGAITQSWALGTDPTGSSVGVFALRNITAGTVPLQVATTGSVTVAAPTSGTAVIVNGLAGTRCLQLKPADSASVGLEVLDPGGNANSLRLNTTNTICRVQAAVATSTLNFAVNSGDAMIIAIPGNVSISAPSSGVALTVNGFAGTHSTKITDAAAGLFNAGYLELPQNIQNAAYAPVLSDSGKHIYHSDGTARTYTIPANASVAYPIGTTLTFVNDASGAVNVTIAITTDTMYWAADGTTGSRTLARYGTATALKVTATRWTISGTGLS